MRRVLAATAGRVLLVSSTVIGILTVSAPAWAGAPSVVVAPALAPLSAATAATCSSYPPAKVSVTLSSSRVEAGATITVSGSGFLPGAELTLTFEPGGEVLATVRASSGGTFTVRVTIPASAAAGNYRIVVSGRACNGLSVSPSSSLVVVQVVPTTTTTTTKPLPFTGASVELPVAIGVVLVAIGLAAVVIGRRRPRTAGRG